jgi:hypothetical protein
MGLLLVFFLAAVVGGLLKIFARRTFVPLFVPVVIFVTAVTFDEYVLPYRGVAPPCGR